jgi:hypothetical protein
MSGLAPHLVMPTRREERVQTLARATPALLFLPMALLSITTVEQPPLALLCAVLGFGVASIALLLPTAVRRVQGMLLVPAINRLLREAAEAFEAGAPERVKGRLDAMAAETHGKLHAYRFLLLHVLAYAEIGSGEKARGLEMLDQLEASGWLDALPIRRTREALVAGQVTTRVSCGDVDGARRLCARLRPTDLGYLSRAARALLALREGASDAAVQLEALLATPAPAERRAQERVAQLGLISLLPADDARAPALREAVRAGGPRPFTMLREGWPALFELAQREQIVGPAPSP